MTTKPDYVVENASIAVEALRRVDEQACRHLSRDVLVELADEALRVAALTHKFERVRWKQGQEAQAAKERKHGQRDLVLAGGRAKPKRKNETREELVGRLWREP